MKHQISNISRLLILRNKTFDFFQVSVYFFIFLGQSIVPSQYIDNIVGSKTSITFTNSPIGSDSGEPFVIAFISIRVIDTLSKIIGFVGGFREHESVVIFEMIYPDSFEQLLIAFSMCSHLLIETDIMLHSFLDDGHVEYLLGGWSHLALLF